MALLREACVATGQDRQARDLSHIPAHVWNASQCEWGESKSCAGTPSSRQPEGDDRCLYAGSESTEARGAEQTGEDGLEKVWFQLTGPNWTMKKNGDRAEVLYFVGVPDGI